MANEGAAGTPIVDKDNMHEVAQKLGGWKYHRKKVATRLVELDNDVTIVTKHGGVQAKRGDFLAEDAMGFPYPVAADEKDRIYEEVET